MVAVLAHHPVVLVEMEGPHAAAITAASGARKPVRPCSTTSGSAPDAKATTGVPQAAASMATSELVSGAVLGTSTQRAIGAQQRSAAHSQVPPNYQQVTELALVCHWRAGGQTRQVSWIETLRHAGRPSQ